MTTQEQTGSLSEAQLKEYYERGYIVLENLLNDEDLDPIRASLAKKVNEIAETLFEEGLITNRHEDKPFLTRMGYIFGDLEPKHFNRFGRSWRDREPGFFDLMSNPKILDAVESLIGGEIFSNPVYNVRPKVPKVAFGAVPWHQDKSYWPDANANPVITVWIPLVDADVENGCLRIAPGTQNLEMASYHQEEVTGTGYTELDDSHLEGLQIDTVPVKAGSPILFNDRCFHMSTTNLSEDRVRWSVDLRYQPTDQDPMTNHGVGFLARSHMHPERVATREDWDACRPERVSG